MQPALSAYLAKGGCLLMLNPGKDRLPEHLGDVGAIFIDREGTGLSLHDAKSAVQAARNRKLAAIIRTDGLSVDEIAACAELGPDGIVLPQAMGYPGQLDREEVRNTVEAVAANLAAAGQVFGLPTTSGAARQYWSSKGAQLLYVPIKAFLQMEKTPCQ